MNCYINNKIPSAVTEFSNHCLYCNETLPYCTDTLVLHSKTCVVVPRPDKSYTYVCCLCNFKTYVSTNIRNHLRSHLGEKPYKCPYCAHQSSRSHDLKKHVNIVH